MRKIHREQAESIIKLLRQAHKTIKKQLESKEIEISLTLLEQCQQSAIELGLIIETEEGEGTNTVCYLEDYCELIYQIYRKITQGQQGNINKQYKSIQNLLFQIENSIRNDIRILKEVVFLPYKVTMWDSLESIWKAAVADKDCDVYVIPIPYYDRNSDRSFGTMHYEGNLYPKYVPITDYQKYNFSERHPDMIFIHNPYDEYNYVTSVHPFFYSKNLKNFTEKLVYIPYFILEETQPDDKEAVKDIAHFCTTPGVFNADNVIVQSEDMRQIYINVLTDFTKNDNKTYWQNKILGLGSPKFDKITKTKAFYQELPECWKKLIEKPDKSQKKIIFYNTSVNGLLKYNEKMLEKMKIVFKVFEKNQDNVTLLWRPHPLLMATIISMRPHLLEMYQTIVDEYKEKGWGIYDDTTDMDRAVALCDAYYGDESSMVQLCRKAGKIIVIQNVETADLNQEDKWLKLPLTFENIYDDGQYFWFTELEYNGLFQLDKQSFQAKFMGTFPDEGFFWKRLYSSIVRCGTKLYFAPNSAKEIGCYDSETKIFTKTPVSVPDKDNHQPWEFLKFSKVAVQEENIYLIPYHYPGILCYNTVTEKLSILDDWVDDIEKMRVNEWGYFLEFEIDKGRLILPCACADAVVIFDTATEKSKIIPTRDTNYQYKYCGICRGGNYFYFISSDGTISKRKGNFIEEKVKTIKLPISEFEEAAYYPIRYMDNHLYLFPFGKNKGFQIDTITDEILEEPLFDDEKEFEGNCLCFQIAISNNKKLYAATGNSRRFIEYDFCTKSKREMRLFVSKEDKESIKRLKDEEFIRWASKEGIKEDEIFSLQYLLEMIQSWERLKDKSQEDMETEAGYKIYHTLLAN